MGGEWLLGTIGGLGFGQDPWGMICPPLGEPLWLQPQGQRCQGIPEPCTIMHVSCFWNELHMLILTCK